MDKALQMKVDKLQFLLKSYGGVAVAFSAVSIKQPARWSIVIFIICRSI